MTQKEVIIVDDEADICILLKGILQKRNFHSLFTNTLSDARKLIQERTPYLLIIDNILPDGRGMDLIPYVKYRYPSVKILMISAFDSKADKNLAFARGADHFVGKPLTKHIIDQAIDQLFVNEMG